MMVGPAICTPMMLSMGGALAFAISSLRMTCSMTGCQRRVPADSKMHRIVLHDPGMHVLGILYYCSTCLEHFAAYGPYRHFASRYGSAPAASPQSLDEWSAWVDQLLGEDL